jgi:hypothetical protein
VSSDEIAERVNVDRRRFVTRLVAGAAFAVPVVSSFDMTSLSMNAASAQSLAANQTSP